MFEFYKELIAAKKNIVEDQSKRREGEAVNLKRLEKLTADFDTLHATYDKLLDSQKAMLEKVPRSEKDWEELSLIGDDLDESEKRLDECFIEINKLIDELPFNDDELRDKFDDAAMSATKKYHLDN